MNKKILSFVVLIAVAITFTACNQNSPKVVAKKWLNSFYHMDYDAAKPLSTDETKKMISFLQQISIKTSDSDKKQMQSIKIDIKDVKEDGDKATVMYLTSNTDKQQPLHLIKQSGKWLVQWTKQDQMEGDMPTDSSDTTNTTGDQPMITDTTAGAKANPASTPQSADTIMSK
ncbi:MAG: DUF4878 domain-containing protein [Taibaiella sp.]|nr:DUF4878 domain-containing protein [Taibaiella sp.]